MAYWLRLYQPLNQQTIGLPVCSGFNDCKFVITPTYTRFSLAKLQKNILKTYQKKFKRKTEKQEQRIKLNRGEKSKYKSLLRWKSFFTRQIVILRVEIQPVSINAAANCNEHI